MSEQEKKSDNEGKEVKRTRKNYIHMELDKTELQSKVEPNLIEGGRGGVPWLGLH